LADSGCERIAERDRTDEPYTATFESAGEIRLDARRPVAAGYDVQVSVDDLVWGATEPAFEHRRVERGSDIHHPLDEAALTDVGSVTFFNSETVATVGRTRLQTGPAIAYRPLADGGLVLVVTPFPQGTRHRMDTRIRRTRRYLTDPEAVDRRDWTRKTHEHGTDRGVLHRRPSYDRAPVRLSGPPGEDPPDDCCGVCSYLGYWDRAGVKRPLCKRMTNTEERLAALRRDSRQQVRIEGAWGVWAHNSQSEIPQSKAREFLRDECATIRAIGVELFNAIAGKDLPLDAEAVDLICELARSDSDPAVRRAAVFKLGYCAPDHLSVETVSEIHRSAFRTDEATPVRTGVVAGMLRNKTDQHMPVDLDLVFEALVDEDPAVRQEIADHNFPWNAATIPHQRANVTQKKKAVLEEAVRARKDLLFRAAEDTETDVARVPARVAGLLERDAAMDLLANVVDRDNEAVQVAIDRTMQLCDFDRDDIQ
jgi:hypothetical protein